MHHIHTVAIFFLMSRSVGSSQVKLVGEWCDGHLNFKLFINYKRYTDFYFFVGPQL